MSSRVQKIYDTFLETCKKGPVLLLASMTDPSHGHTNDPIQSCSPLLRLAIAAAELGVTKLVFDPNEKFVAILGDVVSANRLKSLSALEKVVYAEAVETAPQPKASRPKRVKDPEIPGLFLHWCSLNGRYFDHAVSLGRKKSEISGCLDLPATFKRRKVSHQKALTQVMEHFQKMSKNYAAAAKRTGKVLWKKEAPAAKPATKIKKRLVAAVKNSDVRSREITKEVYLRAMLTQYLAAHALHLKNPQQPEKDRELQIEKLAAEMMDTSFATLQKRVTRLPAGEDTKVMAEAKRSWQNLTGKPWLTQ